MGRRPTVAIVGPGSLGTALAFSLTSAGYPITQISSRSQAGSRRRAATLARKVGVQVAATESPSLAADVIWICVPDSQIRSVAQQLSRTGSWKNKTVLHPSGALSSDELQALRQKGARVASVHPMMTFVRGVTPALEKVPFAIEGDATALRVARQMARDLGGVPFLISKSKKAVYHAWGAFASPLLVAALVTGEQVGRAAGLPPAAVRKNVLPIIRQTIQNYADHGAAGAFSGPIIRGDAATVRKHLRVLSRIPGARDVYAALARSALRHLPSRNRKALTKILG